MPEGVLRIGCVVYDAARSDSVGRLLWPRQLRALRWAPCFELGSRAGSSGAADQPERRCLDRGHFGIAGPSTKVPLI